MTNYTLDNHLQYSIGGRKFGYRENSHEPYSVTVGQVDKEQYRKSSYREELRRTADCVYKEFGKDMVLFLSGGTDSEIVARNFLEIGIKPRCVTVQFDGGYNAPDVAESVAIAKELDLDIDILDFNVRNFYNSGEAIEFGKEIQCTQITYLMVYYNIRKLGLPAVMGGEVVLTKKIIQDNPYWFYTLRENEDGSAMRFSEKYNVPLVNEWFTYTPELLLYYLETDGIKNLVTAKDNYKLTSVSSKNAILKELYPEVRPKVKTHGFERLLGFNMQASRILMNSQCGRCEDSLDGIPYTELMSHLRGKNGN
jgi:hypothetical protein